MTLADIIALPHKHLRQRSQRVSIITDDTKQLIADMQSATLDWEDSRPHELGVALAAVQVDVMQRVVVIRNNFENKTDRTFQVFINPEITKFEGEIVDDYEGCLSIKDIYGKVPRHSKIRVKAMGLDGKEIRLKADGFLARVFQHEIDHTKGIVFVDHIKDTPDAFYTLQADGKLESLDYQKTIQNNQTLWS